ADRAADAADADRALRPTKRGSLADRFASVVEPSFAREERREDAQGNAAALRSAPHIRIRPAYRRYRVARGNFSPRTDGSDAGDRQLSVPNLCARYRHPS